MSTSKVVDFDAVMNHLAGTTATPVSRAAAANIWAGLPPYNGLGLIGALNVKAGNGRDPKGWRNLRAVCNQLAGTTEQEPLYALQILAGLT